MGQSDGGPAFPVTPEYDGEGMCETYSGMDLRDWFAGQALAGQLANPNWPPDPLPAGEEEAAAHWAYSFADAMLAEREKSDG